MKNFIVILFIVGIAVLSISAKVFDKKHVSKDMLRFVESKKYTYSIMRSAIPEIVLKGINEFENGHFNPGDISDSGKIGMGCVRYGNEKFDGQLNFVMVNDSFCLLSYDHGGYAIFNTVYFIQYRPAFTLAKFNNLRLWADTSVGPIIKALQKNPKPDNVWVRKEKN
jgi:hypothetical protein